jgi:hypothetical protein
MWDRLYRCVLLRTCATDGRCLSSRRSTAREDAGVDAVEFVICAVLYAHTSTCGSVGRDGSGVAHGQDTGLTVPALKRRDPEYLSPSLTAHLDGINTPG